MRAIKYIVVHCTGGTQDATVKNILDYWKYKKKWKNPGYHFIIDTDGKTTQLQDLSKASNGVCGYNRNSIHISWIGGKDEDNRTEAQKQALTNIVKVLHAVYMDAEVKGHKDFPKVKKSCPRFDVKQWIKNM